MPVDVDRDVADLLAATADDVVRRAVAPVAAVIDEPGHLPDGVVAALEAAGLLDLPAEPAALTTDVAGRLAAGSAAVALLCVAHSAAHAAGAPPGSRTAFVDGGGGAVTAEPAAGGWELTGTVAADWSTGPNRAATVVVVAATRDGEDRAFAVSRDAPGLVRREPVRTTGLRATGRTDLTLQRTPAAPLGDPAAPSGAGGGAAVPSARRLWLLGLGAAATGVARAALAQTTEYLRQRTQFRTELSRFPALRALVAELDRDLGAAGAAVLAATGDTAGSVVRAAGAACTAAEAAVRVTGEAIQLHGGYGYIAETGIERLFRDALSLRARVLDASARAGDPVAAQLGPR